MQKWNQTEAIAFKMRRGMINTEHSAAPVEYKLYWCKKVVYKSTFYHFCVAERNRLMAHGYKLVNFNISQ